MAERYQGKRVAARKGTKPKRRLNPALPLLAGGITAAVVAWGYLVWTAIDFGGDARDGDGRAWAFLALASIGACACLFIGLMLVARLTRALGITSGPPEKDSEHVAPVRRFPPMEGEDLPSTTAGPPSEQNRAS